MRVLILTQWYPPEPMKLLSDMAETLQTMGHDVTVLTGFPNWPSGKLYPGYRLRLWQREEQSGIQIIRVPLFPDHSRSALKRALNFLSFAISATVLGLWLLPRPDVMHVIHPPVTIGLPAMVLSFVWRIPFTLEIQDMWPENLSATGMVRNEAASRAIGAFAKLVYRCASSIRVISPGFRLNLLSKGVPDATIRVISNWVDTDYYRPVPTDPKLAERFGLVNRFTVLYAGTIGLAQGLDVLIDAARLLQDIPEFQIILAGDGAELERLRQVAAGAGLTNVKFLGRVPMDLTPQLYALADVLFVHLKDDPLFAITIPHKVFTYMASGKMVLAAMRGDVEQLVRTAQCGMVCPPEDAEALASAVRECLRLRPAERAAMGEKGRRVVCGSYSRQQLVERVSAMMEQAVGRRLASRIDVPDTLNVRSKRPNIRDPQGRESGVP